MSPDCNEINFKTTDYSGVHKPHHIVASSPAEPLGANADASVVTDTSGTISGKLRGFVKPAFARMPQGCTGGDG